MGWPAGIVCVQCMSAGHPVPGVQQQKHPLVAEAKKMKQLIYNRGCYFVSIACVLSEIIDHIKMDVFPGVFRSPDGWPGGLVRMLHKNNNSNNMARVFSINRQVQRSRTREFD